MLQTIRMLNQEYIQQTVLTLIIVVVFIVLRIIIVKITSGYAKKSHLNEHRVKLVSKYMDIFIFIFLLVALLAIWGVHPKDLFVVLSSVFAIIGVALFAQWSILSNITSGIILFFSFPFRIGNSIKIHDIDFPIEAQIEDIKAFYVLLRTKEGERLTYPNNLLLQKGISIINTEKEEFHD